jgi:hypothetical protein
MSTSAHIRAARHAKRPDSWEVDADREAEDAADFAGDVFLTEDEIDSMRVESQIEQWEQRK